MKTKFNVGDVIKGKDGQLGQVKSIIIEAEGVAYIFAKPATKEFEGAICGANDELVVWERDIIESYRAKKNRRPPGRRPKRGNDSEQIVLDTAGGNA